jgi:hypothetical protein
VITAPDLEEDLGRLDGPSIPLNAISTVPNLDHLKEPKTFSTLMGRELVELLLVWGRGIEEQ